MGTVQNIGARRLITVLEKVMEDLSYACNPSGGEMHVVIDRPFVETRLQNVADDMDLKKSIL
eukprot:NODE_3926_length_370_cov_372.644860_g3350_i0.p1 GENE.NODE_3926_length_370_cov_372.644860_g3350_i0~~NODE_3926_length_370_cov_372.644860_g3350_i0.p1  ORF type:complete len:71 (-),score=23.46 NODE_3926_length_370_cov_372.644860_g3350_i0:157-342(-)